MYFSPDNQVLKSIHKQHEIPCGQSYRCPQGICYTSSSGTSFLETGHRLPPDAVSNITVRIKKFRSLVNFKKNRMILKSSREKIVAMTAGRNKRHPRKFNRVRFRREPTGVNAKKTADETSPAVLLMKRGYQKTIFLPTPSCFGANGTFRKEATVGAT